MLKPLAEGGSEHAARAHARLNFWGLILGPAVGAVVSAVAFLWVNTSKEHFERQKAQLNQEIRVLKETSPSPLPVSESTPTEAEREATRLRKDLKESQADAEASRKRATQLEGEVRTLKEEKEAKA